MKSKTIEGCCPPGGHAIYQAINSFLNSKKVLSLWLIGAFIFLTAIVNVANAQCFSNADCDDGNPCTSDKCEDGFCEYKFNGPKLEFEIEGDLCAGGTIRIKNKSEDVDDNATYYLDLNSDGSIEGSMSASDLPEDSSLVIPLTGDIAFTVIVVNSDGCSDTLSLTITILDCDDGDACTKDECDDDGCENEPLCHDDDDECALVECVAGVCVTTPLKCDDGDPCTTDECDDGECEYEHNGPELEFEIEGDLCLGGTVQIKNESKHVDPNATYYLDLNSDGSIEASISAADLPEDSSLTLPFSGTLSLTVIVVNPSGCSDTLSLTLSILDCDDGDPCTTDECDDDGCENRPNCDDDNDCTLDECLGGVCVNTAIICDDGDLCTIDKCDDGVCEFKPIKCNDNDPCTIDGCDNGICTHSASSCDDGDPCTRDRCTDDGCKNIPIKCHDKDDGCVTGECVEGECVYTPVDCDDNDLCTIDRCRHGECEHRPLKCRDNDPCTIDGCLDGVCTHTPIDCDDGDICTWDRCTGNGCKYKPIRGCVAPGKTSDSVVFEDTEESSGDEPIMAEGLNEATLSAFPNPFVNELTIEFTVAEDSKVELEIFNSAGQKIATIFEGNVKALNKERVIYNPGAASGGMLIYRLQTDKGSFYNKAMMLK